MNTRRFGLVEWGLTLAIALIWGASFLFIRVGLLAFGPGLVPPLRILFGLLALASLGGARGRVARADWPKIAFLGFIWMALPFLLFAIAERTVSTAVAGMINGAVPLSSAAVGVIWQKQWPSGRRIFALLLGFSGVAAVAVVSSSAGAAHGAEPLGVALLLVAIVCYGVSSNLTGPLQRKYGSVPIIVRAQAVALVLSLPVAIWSLPHARFSLEALGAMVCLGALGTGAAYAMLATLVGRTDATRGTIGVFLTPPVAIVIGALVLHEPITPSLLVGTGLVLAGALLTSLPERPLVEASRVANPPA